MQILTFLYFAYGSNLLAERIHINNPTAVRKGVGLLENYRLDFSGYARRWRGAPATIVPDNQAHVWGAIWEIDKSNLPDLDRQEGVDVNHYFSLDVDVKSPDGKIFKCRVYQQCNNPKESLDVSNLPSDRQPSYSYLSTIIAGAQESGIPSDYINFLKSIKHNGFIGELTFGNISLTNELSTTTLSPN
ncbi:gamma-glutamylcyclotransferase-like [Fopius arisanus]|uniref:gamma-glutamylcyclotransferase n=1 Tax=Fopius arisanus TaxID=64838 RepID=A0A9R1T8Z2_9HYME|nr:PREDICTED: gamma-glutamylcyclotransferase-like [Fopius arisanus]